jgi:serine/threonine-protein kinase
MKTCPVCDTPYPDQHATCPTDGAVLIASREFEPGQIVRGKYRIARKLNQGGMGSVYLAEHLMLGGQLALKFMAPDLSRNPQFIKRFRQEARAAYQLRHPNIVEVIDLDQDENGDLFIAMEFVPGPSLRTVLQNAPHGLPALQAVRIAQGVAAGLAAAHARGTIHRDIKPENILLRSQAEGEDQAKILDFGIAAMTEAITNLSHTRGLLLTPEYAAPEQWRGTPAAELDGRTDLYALGGVLYEMLAGQTPFHARTMEGWMYQHLEGVPEALGKLRPGLAGEYPDLEAVVLRLLARDRDQRFDSALALKEALAAAVAPRPPQARRPTVVEPQPPPRPVTVVEIQPPARPAPKPVPRPVPPPEPEPEPEQEHELLRPSVLRKPTLKFLIPVLFAAMGAGIVMMVMQSRTPADTPTLNQTEGTDSAPPTVNISDTTPNAVIHYTLDGSAPAESSPIYTQPLQPHPGQLIRAMATADGHTPSNEVSDFARAPVSSDTATSSTATLPGSLRDATPYDQGKYSYDHKQYAQARGFFSQSCNSGEMKACNYLGYLYAQGLGGPQSAAEAQVVYQKACDQGTMSSCASLGSLYQNAGDTDNARKYFQKACDGGLSAGCDLVPGLQ